MMRWLLLVPVVVSEVPRPDSTRPVHTLRCGFGPKRRAFTTTFGKRSGDNRLRLPIPVARPLAVLPDRGQPTIPVMKVTLGDHQRFTRPTRDVVIVAV